MEEELKPLPIPTAGQSRHSELRALTVTQLSVYLGKDVHVWFFLSQDKLMSTPPYTMEKGLNCRTPASSIC